MVVPFTQPPTVQTYGCPIHLTSYSTDIWLSHSPNLLQYRRMVVPRVPAIAASAGVPQPAGQKWPGRAGQGRRRLVPRQVPVPGLCSLLCHPLYSQEGLPEGPKQENRSRLPGTLPPAPGPGTPGPWHSLEHGPGHGSTGPWDAYSRRMLAVVVVLMAASRMSGQELGLLLITTSS